MSNNKTVSSVVRMFIMTEDVPQEAKDFAAECGQQLRRRPVRDRNGDRRMNVDMRQRLGQLLQGRWRVLRKATFNRRRLRAPLRFEPKMALHQDNYTPSFRTLRPLRFTPWRLARQLRDDRDGMTRSPQPNELANPRVVEEW